MLMSWQTAAVARLCPRLPRCWIEAGATRSAEERDGVRGARTKPLTAAGVLLRAKATPAATLKRRCIFFDPLDPVSCCCCSCRSFFDREARESLLMTGTPWRLRLRLCSRGTHTVRARSCLLLSIGVPKDAASIASGGPAEPPGTPSRVPTD